MDRADHPFMQIDQFCVAHEPAAGRVDTDAGITADSISLVHMRAQLENLALFGFATDVGDPREMFETFVAVVNEQCGGVRGRMIELHTIEYDPVNPEVEAQMNAGCIQAIEDLNGVILLNTSGFQGSATLCIVEDHETAFITVQPMSDEFMQRGQDRLVITTLTSEESLSWLALDLIAQGALDGKTIGVAAPTTPGQYEAVEVGLVQTLRDNGANVAVFDTIQCDGRVCAGGVSESVQNLRDAGVDVFFNVLNTLSAPGYIQEMVNQGFQPGDVQFYASDFNSQATELVSSKIAVFGGEAAGALYNGAIILDSRDTGSYRLEGYQPKAFNEMCNDTYGANSPSGANHESEDRYDGNSRYGMAVSVCETLRMAFRAIYDAGDNPTRADIYAALANLGAVDSNEMHPASIRPGKTRLPDVIHNLRFEVPCTKPYPFPVDGLEGGVCLYPINEYRPTPG
ncbi:MAG: ABC transporter substrate-binding protein [Acidimicrobiaceae bacterium]|nr:ABC transporter substrate-binding protein [Acidimicrobiaceae bacterium]